MARHLGRKTPEGRGHHGGCMTSVFHFLDFPQRLRIRKMLPDRRHGTGRRVAFGAKENPSTPPAAKDHSIVYPNLNSSMNGHIATTIGSASKVPVEAPVAELPSDPHKKQEMPQMSLRLMRTSSIHHHLAVDVNSVRKTEDGYGYPSNKEQLSPLPESSKKPTNCKPVDSCGSPHSGIDTRDGELEPFSSWSQQSLLEEKLNGARLALLKQLNSGANDPRSENSINQAKDFLGALELLNANKDIFLKIIQDPASISAKDLQEIRSPIGGSFLAISNSFSRSGSFRSSNSSSVHSRKTEDDIESNTSGRAENSPDNPAASSNSAFELQRNDSHKLEEKGGSGKARHHFRNIRTRIKDIIKEKNEERHRISMDGVLHKIPYGQKMSEEVDIQRVLARTEVELRTPSFKRSHSINESIDKYTQLIESSANGESFMLVPQNLKLAGQDGLDIIQDLSGSIERVHSLPSTASQLPLEDDKYGETGIGNCAQLELASPDTISDLHSEDHPDSPRSVEDSMEPEFKTDFDGVDVSFNTDMLCVNVKDEKEFNYIKDVLTKSGFRNGNMLCWFCSNLPMDSSLFLELEESMNRTDDCFNPHETVINLDHLLLFDLMNEVLLEIYDASFIFSPWFSHFRPILQGSRLLEQVWANISRHLNFQSDVKPSLDPEIEQDMAKDEEWKSVRYEKEGLGMELEEWILDDLLDEEILALFS